MKIAILGFGVVGSGVYNLIKKCDYLNDIEVVKIFDKHLNFDEVKDIITDDFLSVLYDENIDLVVETMGAGKFSYKCIKELLKKQKHVITSNKEVIGEHLEELIKISNKNGVSLLFESSCGGGIPLIKPLMEASKINKFSKIEGIINGTTNYILSLMNKGYSMEEALKDAKNKGFAENDPANDLEGLDMVRKIVILSNICFKTNIDVSCVYHYGISNVKMEDIMFCRSNGYTLKFTAISKRDFDSLEIIVEPTLYNKSNILSSINNEFNAVKVETNINGELVFAGKGAGKYPTSNAIINDIIAVKENKDYTYYENINTFEINKKLFLENDKHSYYLRLKNVDLFDEKYVSVKENKMIITNKITRSILLENIDNIEFYARVEE